MNILAYFSQRNGSVNSKIGFFGNIYYTYLAMRIYKINVGMTGNFQELEILGGAYKRTLETWEHQ